MTGSTPAASACDFVRRYNPETDAKTVNMLVGQGVMEGLALANQRVSRHPVVIVIWVALGAALDYWMDWLPKPNSLFTKLAPLMGFAFVMVPIVGFAEWYHRPIWTRLLREMVGAPDMVAIDAYYHLDPESAMIVFDHNGEVSGVIAIDGKKAGEDLGSVLGAEEKQKGDVTVMDRAGLNVKQAPTTKEGLRQRGKKDKEGGAAGNIVQIRHLDVDQPVRKKGIATELLATALDHAFGIVPLGQAPTPADKVIILSNPFAPGGEQLFKKFGFTPVSPEESKYWSQPEAVGLFKWKGRWLWVDRGDWAARRTAILSKKKSG